MEMHISYVSIIEQIMEELRKIDKLDEIKDKKSMENFLRKKGIIEFSKNSDFDDGVKSWVWYKFHQILHKRINIQNNKTKRIFAKILNWIDEDKKIFTTSFDFSLYKHLRNQKNITEQDNSSSGGVALHQKINDIRNGNYRVGEDGSAKKTKDLETYTIGNVVSKIYTEERPGQIKLLLKEGNFDDNTNQAYQTYESLKLEDGCFSYDLTKEKTLFHLFGSFHIFCSNGQYFMIKDISNDADYINRMKKIIESDTCQFVLEEFVAPRTIK